MCEGRGNSIQWTMLKFETNFRFVLTSFVHQKNWQSTKRHHPEINRYDRKHDHSTCPHHYMICFLYRTRTQTQSGMTSWGRKAFFLPKRSLKRMRRKSWPLDSSLLVRQQYIVTLFYPKTGFVLCIYSWNLRNCQSYYYCYLFNDCNEYFWMTRRWTCCI